MSVNYAVKIEKSENPQNGEYRFDGWTNVAEFLNDAIEEELKSIQRYWNGCDGCRWCCYGHQYYKEWCVILLTRQRLHLKSHNR